MTKSDAETHVLKSRYASAFGYYMENLYCKNLEQRKVKFANRAFSRPDKIDPLLAQDFQSRFIDAIGFSEDFLNLFAFWFIDWFDFPSNIRSKRRITDFKLKEVDSQDFFNKLIFTNFVELIKWEENAPIICEIKSSYGPDFPYGRRVSISLTEIMKMQVLSKVGMKPLLVFQVAIDKPRFIEIRFDKLKLPELKTDYLKMLRETVPIVHPGGRVERFWRHYYTGSVSIPRDFDGSFKELGTKDMNFDNLDDLIQEIEKKVPAYLLPNRWKFSVTQA